MDAITHSAPVSDAELIAICQQHLANRDAFNSDTSGLDSDVNPLWPPYMRTCDLISAAKPRTLAGLAAKARVVKEEVTHPDGTEVPEDEVPWMFDLVNDLIRLDDERRHPPGLFPSVLDLGRQVVALSNKQHELDCARLAMKPEARRSTEESAEYQEVGRLMALSYERECALIEIALGMRARTLGDAAVMLGLAWRVLNLGATSEFSECDRERAIAQIRHALLTSLDVVAREAGLNLEETIGESTQSFIDREHADLGDGL